MKYTSFISKEDLIIIDTNIKQLEELKNKVGNTGRDIWNLKFRIRRGK